MKGKGLVALMVVSLLGAAVPVFAALTDAQQKERVAIEQKMLELQKALVKRDVEAGLITEAAAETIIRNMDAAARYRAEVGATGYGPGFGGRMGRGNVGPTWCPLQGGGGGRGMMGGGWW